MLLENGMLKRSKKRIFNQKFSNKPKRKLKGFCLKQAASIRIGRIQFSGPLSIVRRTDAKVAAQTRLDFLCRPKELA
jgi:hypothetical protein